jgi:hypothetical protein
MKQKLLLIDITIRNIIILAHDHETNKCHDEPNTIKIKKNMKHMIANDTMYSQRYHVIKIVIPLIYACCKPKKKKKFTHLNLKLKTNSYILKATFFCYS